jgi:GT2 family glycosyltransferase
MPLIAVAIPTLVGGCRLYACLAALARQTFRDFEIIIVNNGDGSLDLGETGITIPLRIISPGMNIGFGAAVNVCIRSTGAALIATLNDDTEPDSDWLAALVAELETDARVGMCASSIRLFSSEVETLDSAGMLICLDGSSKQRGGCMPAARFSRAEDVLFPSACAALYRREMLDEIGLFEEDFFLYCEDTDLGLRARWSNWHCRYSPAAVVHHHYSATAQPFSPLKAWFVERNRIRVAIRNFPLPLLPAVVGIALARYAWQFLAAFSGRGASAQFFTNQPWRLALLIPLRAWLEAVTSLPVLARQRSRLWRIHRISGLAFLRLLIRHRITTKELAFA